MTVFLIIISDEKLKIFTDVSESVYVVDPPRIRRDSEGRMNVFLVVDITLGLVGQ